MSLQQNFKMELSKQQISPILLYENKRNTNTLKSIEICLKFSDKMLLLSGQSNFCLKNFDIIGTVYFIYLYIMYMHAVTNEILKCDRGQTRYQKRENQAFRK